MNVLSLFDGMSCGRVALERAGIEVDNYYSSEIDKYAIQIANKNYPQDEVNRLGDIITVKASGLPKIDLLIGGSPCQSFSRAGDGSGFDGKSKLFFEYVRLLKECKPKYFLLENVIMKKEWENVITEILGVNPILIDSKLVSAQKRQRLYWTNISGVDQPKYKNITLNDLDYDDRKIINDHPLIIEPHEKYFVITNKTKQGYLIATNGDSVNLEVPNSTTRRGRVGIDKVNTLNTACNYGMIYKNNLVELTLKDYEQLQTLPVGYTKGVSDNQRKKMIGNGWTVDVIAHILKGLK